MSTETLENPVPATLPAVIPDTKEVETESLPLIVEADAITAITTPEEYAAADALVGRINKARKKVSGFIETFFKPHKRRADAVKQGLLDDEKKYLALHDAPLALAREQKLALMDGYVKAVEAENKRLREEAAKKQKEEQEKAAAAQKVIDDAAAAARQEQLRKDEETRLATAEKLEAEGKTAEAEKVLNAPPPPAPLKPIAPPPPRQTVFVPSYAVPVSSSVGKRKNWTWEIEDREDPRACLLKLVKAAAENPDAFLDCLTFNEKTLKDRAKLETQARAPGIRFFNDPITANARG